MKIEALDEIDFETVLAIYNRARASAAGFAIREETVSGLRSQIEGEKVYAAMINEKMVGFVSVWELENFIHHLYIVPEFQNQGIALKLLAECHERYGLPLRLKCNTANQRACQFYERNGWQIEDKANGEDGPYILYTLPSA